MNGGCSAVAPQLPPPPQSDGSSEVIRTRLEKMQQMIAHHRPQTSLHTPVADRRSDKSSTDPCTTPPPPHHGCGDMSSSLPQIMTTAEREGHRGEAEIGSCGEGSVRLFAYLRLGEAAGNVFVAAYRALIEDRWFGDGVDDDDDGGGGGVRTNETLCEISDGGRVVDVSVGRGVLCDADSDIGALVHLKSERPAPWFLGAEGRDVPFPVIDTDNAHFVNQGSINPSASDAAAEGRFTTQAARAFAWPNASPPPHGTPCACVLAYVPHSLVSDANLARSVDAIIDGRTDMPEKDFAFSQPDIYSKHAWHDAMFPLGLTPYVVAAAATATDAAKDRVKPWLRGAFVFVVPYTVDGSKRSKRVYMTGDLANSETAHVLHRIR
jgi:hypothetical protein